MPPFDDVVCSAIEAAFDGVELILHAGDLASGTVLHWLSGIAPVVAARGNNDHHVVDSRIDDVHLLDLAGTAVGMTHILPIRFPQGQPVPALPELAGRCGLDPVPQVWVFGDSHRDLIEWRDGILLLNPGSPTSPHQRVDRAGTVAILDLHGPTPSAEIVHLPVPGHPGSHPLRPPGWLTVGGRADLGTASLPRRTPPPTNTSESSPAASTTAGTTRMGPAVAPPPAAPE